ncbi:MAG: phosphoglycerate dehydrogenase [Gemmatimonadales bacterium]|nr:MAG: phosphoglycerate dehydrogenase [Gemmatimonadales bacterium]
MSFRVLVTDKISQEGLSPLAGESRLEVVQENDSTGAPFLAELTQAHGLLLRSATRVTEELLAGAPSLRVVGRAGVGVDNIDIEACTRRGVAVFNAPAGNTVSAAELAFALILASARRIAAADRSVRVGEWDRSRFKGTELRGKALGLVGAGRIGGEVARRARAFGMKLLIYDPYLTDERVRELGGERRELDDLLREADMVSLHVPLTESTRGLLDRHRLSLLKPSTHLVNASRGGVVDEEALAEALCEGRLAGAALDVYASEPLAEDSPLRSAPDLLLTPHLGASTLEAQERVASEVAQAVRAALLDGDLAGALNAPSVGGAVLRRLGPLLDLARRLGRLAVALAPGGISAVEVGYAGDADDALGVLPRHVLMGLLTPVLGRDQVNVVNAAVLAENRGISVSTRRLARRTLPGERVEVEVTTSGGPVSLDGALLGEHHPRLVGLDGYDVNVAPSGTLLVLRNRDVPGVIGRVGTLLGAAGLNIAEYHQARRSEGGDALAAVVLDGAFPGEVLEQLAELPEITDARVVELD